MSYINKKLKLTRLWNRNQNFKEKCKPSSKRKQKIAIRKIKILQMRVKYLNQILEIKFYLKKKSEVIKSKARKSSWS